MGTVSGVSAASVPTSDLENGKATSLAISWTEEHHTAVAARFSVYRCAADGTPEAQPVTGHSQVAVAAASLASATWANPLAASGPMSITLTSGVALEPGR